MHLRGGRSWSWAIRSNLKSLLSPSPFSNCPLQSSANMKDALHVTWISARQTSVSRTPHAHGKQFKGEQHWLFSIDNDQTHSFWTADRIFFNQCDYLGWDRDHRPKKFMQQSRFSKKILHGTMPKKFATLHFQSTQKKPTKQITYFANL